MDVRCDKCQARYRIDDTRVGPAGLTMRCGKCSNTFKVTQAAASTPPPAERAVPPAVAAVAPAQRPPGSPAAIKPAAKPPVPALNDAGATMVFGQAPVLPRPATKKPAAAASNDAGATMVFGQAQIPVKVAAPKTVPPRAAAPAPSAPAAVPTSPKPQARPAAALGNDAGATMVFGQAPIAKPTAPPPPRAPPPAADAAGATMVFSAVPRPAPVAAKKPAASNAVSARAKPAPEPAVQLEDVPEEPVAPAPDPAPEQAAAPEVADYEEPRQARAGESVGEDDLDPAAITGEQGNLVVAEDAEQEEEPEPGLLSKGPPKGLLIGAAASIGALVIAILAVFAVHHLGQKPPPDAAVQALEQAKGLADKDSIALYPQALETTRAALAAAPKSPFGEAHATETEVEVAWSDALNDLASQWTDIGSAAQNAGDDKKKAEADTKVADYQTQAKAQLKAALEAGTAGKKRDRTSPAVAVALADCYRASHATSMMNKQLKIANGLHADPGTIALVVGIALTGDDDSAEKAVSKLKEAVTDLPQSARAHYRLAQEYASLHKDAERLAELKTVLKLSPTHERAKADLAAIAAAAPAESPPAAERTP